MPPGRRSTHTQPHAWLPCLVWSTLIWLVITDLKAERLHRCQEVALLLLTSLPEGVKHVSLTGLEGLTTDICDALASMPCLLSLSLRETLHLVMDQMVYLVGCVKGLKRLKVVGCEGPEDSEEFQLQHCKRLERGHGCLALGVEWEQYDREQGDSV